VSKHTILFLAANPLDTDWIALDEEARAIQEELERSGHRDRFELVTRWATRPLDLLRELRKLKPTIVHFSGHGGRRVLRSGSGPRRDIVTDFGAVDDDLRCGLFFQGPYRRPQLVSTAALEATFGAAGSSVRLVVLNACYSNAQAEALLSHIDCVVGMGGSIRDDAARNFAVGFYGGIGERESVSTAYRQGCVAITLEGLPDSERPQLNVRPGVDADRLVLAEGLDGSSTANKLLAWATPDTDPEALPQIAASTQIHPHQDDPSVSGSDRGPHRVVVLAPVLSQRTHQPTSLVPDTESSMVSAVPLCVERGEIADEVRARGLHPVLRPANATISTDENGGTEVDAQRVTVALPILPQPSMARLVVMRGTDTGRLLEVRPGKTYTIGRGIDNDLVLTDMTVSRKHFDLQYESGGWAFVDHASGNGTAINDRNEVGPYMLTSGDTIEVGTTVFRFDVITTAASLVSVPRERPSHEAPAANAWVRKIVTDLATLELLLGMLQARRHELRDNEPERAKIDQLIGALVALELELRREQRTWE
jgi:Inner membrane component of T3SS, cytoplasmic domain/CHAT domain